GRFGGEVTRALWDAGETGIQQIRAITAALNLDCGLASVPGYLHLPGLTETELRADLETAQRLDIPADYEESVPFFRQPGIRFPNQARFHPIEYLAGVASAVERMGGLIYESTSATDFTNGARIGVGPYTIEASNVVIATHSPITGEASALSAALLQTKLSLYTSYALCAQIPKTAIADCLYWDTRDPYSYLRIHSDA